MQFERPEFNPWVGKIPWRREQQPTAVFLLGRSHGQKSLVVYSPWGCKELYMTEQLSLSFFFFNLDIKLANNKNYHCITYKALLYIIIKFGSRCYYYCPISWKMKLKLKDIWQPTQGHCTYTTGACLIKFSVSVIKSSEDSANNTHTSMIPRG